MHTSSQAQGALIDNIRGGGGGHKTSIWSVLLLKRDIRREYGVHPEQRTTRITYSRFSILDGGGGGGGWIIVKSKGVMPAEVVYDQKKHHLTFICV